MELHQCNGNFMFDVWRTFGFIVYAWEFVCVFLLLSFSCVDFNFLFYILDKTSLKSIESIDGCELKSVQKCSWPMTEWIAQKRWIQIALQISWIYAIEQTKSLKECRELVDRE